MHTHKFWRAYTDFSWEEEPKLTRELTRLVQEAEHHERSHRTARLACEGLTEWEKDHGYDVGPMRGGLKAANDWSLQFYRAQAWGMDVWVVQWSRIEFIWIPKDQPFPTEATWQEPA